MTENEIETVLGGPAGDYRTRPNVRYEFISSGFLGDNEQVIARTREWDTDEYAIEIDFGPDGKAVQIVGLHAVRSSVLERIPLLRMLVTFLPIL
jgi:hypothetical protein